VQFQRSAHGIHLLRQARHDGKSQAGYGERNPQRTSNFEKKRFLPDVQLRSVHRIWIHWDRPPVVGAILTQGVKSPPFLRDDNHGPR
jgi:hypothetical protein